MSLQSNIIYLKKLKNISNWVDNDGFVSCNRRMVVDCCRCYDEKSLLWWKIVAKIIVVDLNFTYGVLAERISSVIDIVTDMWQ